MLKPAFITILSFFIFYSACAQSDTAVYYLQKSGKTVSTRDSAAYYRLVYPSGAATDSGLFVVKEFYMSGKLKWNGFSKTNNAQVKLQGQYTAYFVNGNKMLVKHFTNGKQDGDETGFYPNGKFYYSKTKLADKTIYNEYRDSTGNVLAKNGNGKWITYPTRDFSDAKNEVRVINGTGKLISDPIENFFSNKIEGQVVNGHQEGEWSSRLNDSMSMTTVYHNGEQTAQYQTGSDGQKTYYMLRAIPEFPGGAQAFGQFLGQNIVYPIVARQNNTQGRVIITFVVDAEGKLTDIKVVRGIGSGCDEEAVRVLKLSPLWTPGMVDNKPVRTQYSVPISFSLGK